jgi:hypothetical protein
MDRGNSRSRYSGDASSVPALRFLTVKVPRVQLLISLAFLDARSWDEIANSRAWDEIANSESRTWPPKFSGFPSIPISFLLTAKLLCLTYARYPRLHADQTPARWPARS